MEEKKKKKNTLLTIIQLILVGVIAYSLFNIGSYYYQNYKSTQKLRKIETIVGDIEKELKVVDENKTGETNNEQAKDVKPEEKEKISKEVVKKLKSMYPDVVAYVKVDDVDISYPVTYRKEDNDFYLYKDLDKDYSLPGTIFMNGWNNPDFSDMNTTFFGHNLRVRNAHLYEAMFKNLHKYEDKAFVDAKDEHIVQVYTDQGVKEYVIFAAYFTDINNNYIEPNRDKKSWPQYLEKIKASSINDFKLKQHFTEDSKILTLSTCTDALYSIGRFVVHALEIQ